MKKIGSLIILILVSIITLTSCGKKDDLKPTAAMIKALENIQKLKNYKMNIKMNINILDGNEIIDTSLDASSIIDMKNKTGKMNMKKTSTEESYDTELYMTFSDDSMTVYVKDDDMWSKNDKNISLKSMVDDANEFLNSASVKKINSDKKNYNYELILDEKIIEKLTELITDELDEFPVDLKTIMSNTVINVSIDKETGNYSEIYIDMTDALKKELSDLSNEIKVNTIEFIIKISNYNQNDNVVIPSTIIDESKLSIGPIETAKKGAAEDIAYSIRKEAQFYYQLVLIENINEFNSPITVTFNNGNIIVNPQNPLVDFELYGTIPTTGYIQIDPNGDVSGKVEINGYNCPIVKTGTISCEKN